MTNNPSNPTQTEDWVMVDPRLIEEAISGLKAHTGSATEETQTRLRAMLSAAPTISPRGRGDGLEEAGAQGEIERLRVLIDKIDALSIPGGKRLASPRQTFNAIWLLARSALASEPKNSDVQQVKP